MKVILWWKLCSDESYLVMKKIEWWKLSSDENYLVKKVILWWRYLVMKVILWWKLSCSESYFVMKVILWWKLSCDESYLVMKVLEVEIAKEVIRSNGWWRFACGDVFHVCMTCPQCCEIVFGHLGPSVTDVLWNYCPKGISVEGPRIYWRPWCVCFYFSLRISIGEGQRSSAVLDAPPEARGTPSLLVSTSNWSFSTRTWSSSWFRATGTRLGSILGSSPPPG